MVVGWKMRSARRRRNPDLIMSIRFDPVHVCAIVSCHNDRSCLRMCLFMAPSTPDGCKFVQELANLLDVRLWSSQFCNLSPLLDHPCAQFLILRDGENGGHEVSGVGRIEEQGSTSKLLFRPADARGYHGATQCECLQW